jgi:hypothetical protein
MYLSLRCYGSLLGCLGIGEYQYSEVQFRVGSNALHFFFCLIQEKFFQLLEFIVFQVNFVPCKELISLSILLKGQTSVSCSITCMQTLLNILR